ncbi:DUF4870 domain-containing protein [Tessaracoccus antarcticus]|uniref:DUF4870 domain-containing protein n=1 Tax=Tessaracoccus antarcticus TaxID=2479848 RepID=A0A3M0GG59_9ACTN|nr:DUF4870 domain-containing protein [Tessaracoccus antarcticus]
MNEESAPHASAPDATPLLDASLGDAPSATGTDEAPEAKWWETGQNIGSSAAPQPPYGQGQQPPYGNPAQGQQAPWAGGPGAGQQSPYPGQNYQAGPPMGGMPQQPYTGGYAPMPTGQNNPNWLVGPTEQGRSTLQLDYWLSVFFSWIPSLIFFLTERDKNQLVDEHTKELLNFNITRVIVGAVTAIPIVGWIVGGIGSIVLFVMAIIGAMKGTEEYGNGRVYRFPLTFRFIK